jgi:hypothetical protein
LEGIVLIDGDEGDDGDSELLRRTFDQVGIVGLLSRRFFDNEVQKSTGAGPGGNGVKPSLYTVINAIVDGRLPLLDFNYFNVSPCASLTSRADGRVEWTSWIA